MKLTCRSRRWCFAPRTVALLCVLAIGAWICCWSEQQTPRHITSDRELGDNSWSQVYLDPQTGRIVQPAAGQALAPTRSAQEFDPRLERSPSPGGGFYYRTGPDQMHFQVATIDANGEVRSECYTGHELGTDSAEGESN